MKRFGFLSAKTGKVSPAKPERTQWRAHEDHPLSLTTPQRGETATSQRALVLGFAALAVAGAAYFGTIMLAHKGNEGTSLFAKADAATAQAAPAAPNAKEPVPAAAAPAAAPVVATPAAKAPAKPLIKQATAQAANPLLPTPVKVTTITVPARPSKPAAVQQAAAPTQSEADQRWARLAAEGGDAEAKPVVTEVSAYTQDSKKMVSDGVEAVLREVSTEKPAKPVVVASVSKPTNPVAQEDSEPEMAGSEPTTSRQARIRSAVNLRSRPAAGSKVIGVIPTNATVGLAPGCRHWCRVSFKGQTGFIYKSFLR